MPKPEAQIIKLPESDTAKGIEPGDVVAVRNVYLSPSIIVSDACPSTKRVAGFWFDKDNRIQTYTFHAKDLIIQRKRDQEDMRLAS